MPAPQTVTPPPVGPSAANPPQPAAPPSGVPATGAPASGVPATGVPATGAPAFGVTATLEVEEHQLRVSHADARRALAAVAGQDLVAARARLRYGPGRTCEPLARLLDAAAVRAERAGLDPALLLIAASSADPGEDIVRVRRKAHGKADWIHSPTSRIRLTLRPAGLYASQPEQAASLTAETRTRSESPSAEPFRLEPPSDGGAGDGRWPAAVREALFDVLDPDLGVNIVDLGFVRDIRAEGRTTVITMTLTSAACPLTGVMEDQIRAALAGLPDVDGFRADWVWLPAWHPRDITPSGREQLQAIGFTIS